MPTILDCTGLKCPQPVLRTKDALEAMSASGELEVLVDNEAARANVERFACSQGCMVAVEATGGENYRLRITKRTMDRPTPLFSATDYPCEVPAATDLVYVIPADTMGRGDEDLGRILMRAFVKTIGEMNPLPAKIFFYNAGVRLTASDSDLLAPLKELQEEGVQIFSCGTCLDFFNLKKELRVGEITNMYDIMDSMTRAAKIISPF